MLLESGTVYSESKEKAASRFYIMQCYRTTNEEVIQLPVQDLIKRFVLIAIVLQLSDDSGPEGSDDREMGLFPISQSGGVIYIFTCCKVKYTCAHTTVLHINVTTKSSYELVYKSLRIKCYINLPF